MLLSYGVRSCGQLRASWAILNEREQLMTIKPFNSGTGAQKTERWSQSEIDAIERAKEQQRRREEESSRQRDANAQGTDQASQ